MPVSAGSSATATIEASSTVTVGSSANARSARATSAMTLLVSNRSYRLLFSASAIPNLGDGVSALAFPCLATLLTRVPALIALVAFATRLPWFLFAIPAGVLVDRRDRRRLIVQADTFRLLLTAGVIALVFSVPSFPPDEGATTLILALSVLAFLLGSAEVVRDNAAQTVLPSIVAKRELRSEEHTSELQSLMRI